jgi:predicted nuclease of predicted toxin-antitoxin system
MRFLADMGVSQRVVHWLREAGHEAVHLREEGLQRLPDAQVFSKAIEERRMVLTFDLDFGEIAALAGEHAASVVLFRLQDTSTPHVIERLSAVLTMSAVALQDSAIVIVEERRQRIPEGVPVVSQTGR